MSELKAKARRLVREAKLLRGRPDACNLVRHRSGPHEVDRLVEPFATLLVGVDLRLRDAADVERAVVAGSIAHERVDDVEERLISRAEQTIGKDMRVRVAAV